MVAVDVVVHIHLQVLIGSHPVEDDLPFVYLVHQRIWQLQPAVAVGHMVNADMAAVALLDYQQPLL
jgi:hypothetical protein